MLWSTPNPFVGGTTIAYRIPGGSADGVSVVIYEVSGRMVRTLHTPSAAGATGPIRWDGTDDAGRALPGGIYLLRLPVAARTVSERVIKIG
jgi:flagellar hook assembly protein FlgD